MEFLEAFPYVIKYKIGNSNVLIDALSRRYALITMMNAKLLGFELIRNQYVDDPTFAFTYLACEKWAVNGYYRHGGYLFRSGRLCIPNGSIREFLVRKAYGESLASHFDENKILKLVKERFY